jgi:chromosome segregation ATPase
LTKNPEDFKNAQEHIDRVRSMLKVIDHELEFPAELLANVIHIEGSTASSTSSDELDDASDSFDSMSPLKNALSPEADTERSRERIKKLENLQNETAGILKMLTADSKNHSIQIVALNEQAQKIHLQENRIAALEHASNSMTEAFESVRGDINTLKWDIRDIKIISKQRLDGIADLRDKLNAALERIEALEIKND